MPVRIYHYCRCSCSRPFRYRLSGPILNDLAAGQHPAIIPALCLDPIPLFDDSDLAGDTGVDDRPQLFIQGGSVGDHSHELRLADDVAQRLPPDVQRAIRILHPHRLNGGQDHICRVVSMRVEGGYRRLAVLLLVNFQEAK